MLPPRKPLSEAEIDARVKETTSFVDALSQFLTGYTLTNRISPWSVLIGLETMMADVLVTLPEKMRASFLGILDIRKRTSERMAGTSIKGFTILSDDLTKPDNSSNGG